MRLFQEKQNICPHYYACQARGQKTKIYGVFFWPHLKANLKRLAVIQSGSRRGANEKKLFFFLT